MQQNFSKSDPQASLTREGKRRTEWRFMRGWTSKELQEELTSLKGASVNFPYEGPESQEGTNWHRYYSENVVGLESPGEIQAGGTFTKVWDAICNYKFSDPDIVEGHFNAEDEMKNRSILLEIKVMGLRYLCGVRIGAIKKEKREDRTVYGFRYDTLAGHMETGSEWFLLTKDHKTGEIWFRISASWRPGIFPNWWSRMGFLLLSERYQLTWHRLAYLRLREIAGGGSSLKPVPSGKGLVHTGPEITNSDLWKLEKPTAVEKVLTVGQTESPLNESSEKSSSKS